MKRDYLPIGTVVLLKKGKKPLMIYGRTQKIENVDNLVDYIGVPYPEGFISNDMVYYFDNSSIEKILYYGYVNDDEISLRKYIQAQVNEIQNNNIPQTNITNN